MPKKEKQLGFRCTEEIHELLRATAYQRRVSIQALLEEALDAYFSNGQQKNTPPQTPQQLSDASPKELDFLEKMLVFFRHAPEDLVRSYHSMAAHFWKLAKREEESQAGRRGRAG